MAAIAAQAPPSIEVVLTKLGLPTVRWGANESQVNSASQDLSREPSPGPGVRTFQFGTRVQIGQCSYKVVYIGDERGLTDIQLRASDATLACSAEVHSRLRNVLGLERSGTINGVSSTGETFSTTVSRWEGPAGRFQLYPSSSGAIALYLSSPTGSRFDLR